MYASPMNPFMLLFIPWAVLIAVAVYVYTALCLREIGRKLHYGREWIAWIPFVNSILLLELGGVHWAYVFLLFIPVVGWFVLWVLTIAALWKICERLHYPGWIALFVLLGSLAFLIVISILAWADNRPHGKSRKK